MVIKLPNIFRYAAGFLATIFLLLFSAANGGEDLFLSPGRGETVEGNRPSIRLSFGSQKADPATVKILVNGEDVTVSAIRSFAFVAYSPLAPLPQGENTAQVAFRDKDGKEVMVKWSFFVSQESLIQSASHDGGEFMTLGQALILTVKGKPGCTGSFDVGHLRREIPLEEKAPGHYQGTFTLGEGDHLQGGIITARLKDAQGGVSALRINAPERMSASYFRVRIHTPRQGDRVGRQFEVRGHTLPDVWVTISSGLGFETGEESGVGTNAPPTGGVKVKSGPDGSFSQKMGFPPIVIKGMKMRIYIFAFDQKGDRSIPDQVVVYYSPEGERDRQK